jgi:hypothetical protein
MSMKAGSDSTWQFDQSDFKFERDSPPIDEDQHSTNSASASSSSASLSSQSDREQSDSKEIECNRHHAPTSATDSSSDSFESDSQRDDSKDDAVFVIANDAPCSEPKTAALPEQFAVTIKLLNGDMLCIDNYDPIQPLEQLLPVVRAHFPDIHPQARLTLAKLQIGDDDAREDRMVRPDDVISCMIEPPVRINVFVGIAQERSSVCYAQYSNGNMLQVMRQAVLEQYPAPQYTVINIKTANNEIFHPRTNVVLPGDEFRFNLVGTVILSPSARSKGVYHCRRNCSSLSRSKTLGEMPLSQARREISFDIRPCKLCGNLE